ncbi:WXG100 family type VII secretion target [Actinoplanes sp. NPDC026619]|uniref:WXG100 family type VII secretion target n=1 Tax=Actinoplanes sp. NPDC026619 TaxID=3155798 RepID=UPI003401C572
MAVGTNLSLEEVQRLANSLRSEEAKLRTELGALYSRSQRDPMWTGNAAVKYDEYLQKWRQGQDQLLDALTGIVGELNKLAGNIAAIDRL